MLSVVEHMNNNERSLSRFNSLCHDEQAARAGAEGAAEVKTWLGGLGRRITQRFSSTGGRDGLHVVQGDQQSMLSRMSLQLPSLALLDDSEGLGQQRAERGTLDEVVDQRELNMAPLVGPGGLTRVHEPRFSRLHPNLQRVPLKGAAVVAPSTQAVHSPPGELRRSLYQVPFGPPVDVPIDDGAVGSADEFAETSLSMLSEHRPQDSSSKKFPEITGRDKYSIAQPTTATVASGAFLQGGYGHNEIIAISARKFRDFMAKAGLEKYTTPLMELNVSDLDRLLGKDAFSDTVLAEVVGMTKLEARKFHDAVLIEKHKEFPRQHSTSTLVPPPSRQTPLPPPTPRQPPPPPPPRQTPPPPPPRHTDQTRPSAPPATHNPGTRAVIKKVTKGASSLNRNILTERDLAIMPLAVARAENIGSSL